MIEAIKHVFSNYANFKGRSTRAQYWWFMLFYYIIYFGILLGTTTGSGIFAVAAIIFYLGILLPLLAVTARRMHDAGKSAWFMLIPIYNLVLALTPSEPNDNKWGPNPQNPHSFDFENKPVN